VANKALVLLFICHASEDQSDFVKPLADALAKEFEVWYAPYELHVGDSLRQKIDDGLKRCDYGIVVLSHAFFAKNWPQNELDALFGLEKQSRKMILPIWKDVTKEDVQKYSPLLAGRFAAEASKGIQQVVHDIKLAIGAAQQQRELSALETATNKVAKLQQTVTARDREKALLFSERGVQLIREALQKLYDVIRTALSVGSSNSKSLKFAISNPTMPPRAFFARTLGGLRLDICIRELGQNCAADAYLEVTIVQQHFDHYRDLTRDYSPIDSQRFKPGFTDELVIWRQDKLLFTTDDLAEHLISEFVEAVTENIQDEEYGQSD
jgi:hypothetical protein